MKPIIKQEQQDTILTSDITDSHLVVAVINGQPRILGRGWMQSGESLTFFALKGSMECITTGNGIPYSDDENTPQKMVEYTLTHNNPVAVFPQSDWKAALKWLIDNA